MLICPENNRKEQIASVWMRSALADPDRLAVQRTFQAMFMIQKLDVVALKAVFGS
jgi:hypothetical protein